MKGESLITNLLHRRTYETFTVLPLLKWKPLSARIYFLITIHSRFYLLNRYVRKVNTILDLGCGGGYDLLQTKGSIIIGVDLSLEALKNARLIYTDCVRADIRYLPFRGLAFDQAVSIDVLGHIPIPHKDKVLSEIRRVAHSGLHVVECDSVGFLTSFAKKNPRAYKKYFIQLDGHVGLERATAIVHRFRSYFKTVKCVKVCSEPITSMQEYLMDCVLGIASKLWNSITPLDIAACICVICER